MNQTILLTAQNAHRVKTVRPVDNPQSEPSRFNYRGQRLGFRNHLHTIGEGSATSVYKDNYLQWEVVEFYHPDYLGCYWQLAQGCLSQYLARPGHRWRGLHRFIRKDASR